MIKHLTSVKLGSSIYSKGGEMRLDNIIGEIITAKRESAGLSKSELARLSGLTPSAITYYEQGIRKPNIPSMSKICRVLGMSIDELLSNDKLGYDHVANLVGELKSKDWQKMLRVEVVGHTKQYKVCDVSEREEEIVITVRGEWG